MNQTQCKIGETSFHLQQGVSTSLSISKGCDQVEAEKAVANRHGHLVHHLLRQLQFLLSEHVRQPGHEHTGYYKVITLNFPYSKIISVLHLPVK